MLHDKTIVILLLSHYEVVYGAMFNDLERPITHISTSRQYSTLNMSLTVGLQDRHIFRPTVDN